jgi:hypothetical protein
MNNKPTTPNAARSGEHTPTPWTCGRKKVSRHSFEYWVTSAWTVLFRFKSSADEKHLANLEFIVEACNQHAALLASNEAKDRAAAEQAEHIRQLLRRVQELKDEAGEKERTLSELRATLTKVEADRDREAGKVDKLDRQIGALHRAWSELAYHANVLANARTKQERDAAALKVFTAIGDAKDAMPGLLTLEEARAALSAAPAPGKDQNAATALILELADIPLTEEVPGIAAKFPEMDDLVQRARDIRDRSAAREGKR